MEPSTKILVVGGDSHFSYLMRRYAKMSTHPIKFADWGDDILSLAQKEKPAVILLQVNRVRGHGWDMLSVLKNNPDTLHIPIVLCSWMDEESDGLGAGANAFLRMPVLFDDFVAALARIGIPSKQVAG